jgi:hypothetical protein
MPFLGFKQASSKQKQRTILVLKDKSVTRHALLEVDDGLVGILHLTDLDPWLDRLIGSKLKHLLDLLGGTDERATNLDAVGDESEGIDGREVATVGSTNLDESAANLQEGEVLGHRHLLAGDSADDQIEGTGVLRGPVLVLSSGNVLVSTELEDVVALVVLAGDTNDTVSTKGLGEQDTKVTETTDTDDTDGLSGTTAVMDEGRVDGNTTAKHGSSIGGLNSFGDLDDEGTVGAVVVGVATVGLVLAVGVDGSVGVDGLLAVGHVAVLAVNTLEARLGLGTNTDAVADLDVLNLLANTDSLANNLVANAARVGSWAPAGRKHVNVRTADTAVGDLDVDVGLLKGLSLNISAWSTASMKRSNTPWARTRPRPSCP